MDVAFGYPKRCRKSIHLLMNETGMSADVAYSLMLMTATLMDLHPEDEQVVHIILQDCGVEIE